MVNFFNMLQARDVIELTVGDEVAFHVDRDYPNRVLCYQSGKIIVGIDYLGRMSEDKVKRTIFASVFFSKFSNLESGIFHELGHHMVQKHMAGLSDFDDVLRETLFDFLKKHPSNFAYRVFGKAYHLLPEEIMADFYSLVLKRKFKKNK